MGYIFGNSSLLKPDSAEGLMEYARQEDPILAFMLAVGSKAVGGFMGMMMTPENKNYFTLEEEYTQTIMEEWPAFTDEVRRRNKEAGREKMPFGKMDQEAFQYFTKRMEENLAKEEDPERKKILEGIQRVVKPYSFQIFNLLGDFLDPLHNSGTMEFVER